MVGNVSGSFDKVPDGAASAIGPGRARMCQYSAIYVSGTVLAYRDFWPFWAILGLFLVHFGKKVKQGFDRL